MKNILAFIPKNLLAETQNKKMKKIKYIYAREWRTPDKILIDQYYESNLAITRVIEIKEFNQIARLKEGEPIKLYYEVFPNKEEIN